MEAIVIPELTLDQIDQLMIEEYEKRKQAILMSDMPVFFGPDPSIY